MALRRCGLPIVKLFVGHAILGPEPKLLPAALNVTNEYVPMSRDRVGKDAFGKPLEKGGV
jgi:hypothetical protein